MARFHALTGRALAFLFLMWSLWFTNFTARTILSPVLPLIEDEFSVTHARATSIFLFLGLGYGLSVFFSGVYARLLGPRKSLCASLVALGLTFIAVSLIRTFDLFYTVAFVIGIAAGMYLPAAIPFLTEYYDQAHWGKVIAIHDSASCVSLAATPFIAILLLLFLPWRGLFIVVAVAYFLGAIIFYAVSEEVKTAASTTYFPVDVLKRGSLWFFGIIWVFMSGATMGLYFVVPLYLTKELSFTVEGGNFIFGVSRIGGAVVAIISGFLVDRFRAKRLIFLLVVTTGLFTALVAVKDLRWIKVFLFLQATTAAGFFPVSLVAISRMVERETRGQAVGFIITLGVFGLSVIPYLLGLSGDLISFRVGFLLLGAVTVLSSGLLYFVKELR